MRGTVYPLARRLELERAEARVRDVTARLAGHIAMPSGTFRFTNGKSLSVVPDIDLHFSVPRVSCAKLLSSIPSALVPRLQGFVLQGFFAADVGAKIDFAHLDDLDLTGKVGIDGCKVVKAPDDVKALANPETLVINVDVPKLPGQPARRDRHHPGGGRPRQPRLRALRSDLAVPGRLDHDHRGQRLLQAPRLGQLGVQERAAPQPRRGAGSGWGRRRSPCRW